MGATVLKIAIENGKTGRWVGQLFFVLRLAYAHRPVIARWISPVAKLVESY